ncbi:SHOCT domain-containing protein [Mycobacterium sp. 1245805.9]|uniref:SHOCT domain-containing protein n=1 Tax=Mycobacterium sp. 1245805.9 TaxID=1856862 RepID=UPI0007FF9984|nr:SHOCT domain-containing protein [Mycobacterium sp. 1245805.9]OBI91085.1 hypothetical protein A9X00_17900 [Mycobacterium sp. 1245805.9]
MKATVTPEAASAIAEIAQRHGLSQDAVLSMLVALRIGGGTMAQFNIPELGGNGQWMRGGKHRGGGEQLGQLVAQRVDAGLERVVEHVADHRHAAPPPHSPAAFASNNWWPADLGVPSSVGGQNDVRYAFFPSTRRLAIHINGVTRIFDTGEHQIGGVQQQQGTGYSSVSFTSQFGTFGVSSLHEVGSHQAAQSQAASPAPGYQAQYQSGPPPQFAPEVQFPPEVPAAKPASAPTDNSGDSQAIVAAIESLAGLHERGILSDEEFAAKKAELLSRL